MAITANTLRGKWRMMPGTETVTYFSRRTDGSFPSSGTSVAAVEKRPVTKTQVAAGYVEIGKEAKNFHPWTEKLGSIVPKVGDKLTDAASVTWHVVDVAVELLDQRYRLLCVRAA